VNLDLPCQIWTGSTSRGYGTRKVGDKVRYTHILAWEAVNGPVPAGLVLDHLCRQPLCREPEHLEPVTQQVNSLRGKGICAVYARQTHCKRGHEKTDANSYWRPDGTGRMCLLCVRIRYKQPEYRRRSREYQRRKRQMTPA